MNKEELIKNPKNLHPHVVLLGAGASRAAFPKGDADNKKLPVMSDLVDILDLTSLLKSANIDPKINFETIYSNLANNELRKTLEKRIYDYFSALTLPETVTHDDRLLLSLRKKDAVFTFNWDPFLFDAYIHVKLGYAPDGYGLHYRRPVSYGDKVIVDDDLVIYLIKQL